jgi:hypothetical protein
MISTSQNSTLQNIWQHTQNLEGDWFLPMSEYRMWTMTECRRWYSGSSAAKPKYKYAQNFQDDWCSIDIDMENFAPWWFLSISPTKSITALIRRSRELCTILWTMATHSVQGWGSIYLGWYTNTRNSHSWAHEKPHEIAECNFQHRFSV